MKFFSFVFILPSFFLLIQTQQFASVDAVEPPRKGHVFAPALYVFGDSLVDSGNNNYLQTQAKVNYTPYGIDFRNGATGRFTNGKTVVDFIASWLGLPYVPSYLSLSEKQKRKTKTGVSYASGAGGILPESGTVGGDNLCLEEQINYFTKTVKKDLPKIFKNHKKIISKYLSKSIFVISIGSNDYINNYLLAENYNSSKTYTPQQYADLLVSTLKKHLTSIYSLGARKFVVFELGPIGCLPGIVLSVSPKPSTPCVEDINSLVKIFNVGVAKMIQELTSTLKGATFVSGDIFEKSYQQHVNPRKYGFSGGNTPCCSISDTGSVCLPNKKPCKNRKDYLHWDGFHPTQRVNYETANGCFKGSSTCFPINVHKLALI